MRNITASDFDVCNVGFVGKKPVVGERTTLVLKQLSNKSVTIFFTTLPIKSIKTLGRNVWKINDNKGGDYVVGIPGKMGL